MSNSKLALCAAVLVLLATGAARAADEPADDQFFGLSVGAKGAIGGNIWSPPEDVAPGYILFDDLAGGWGGGGGLYTELRVLWGHLGLEVDLLFERNRNMNRITWNDVLETDWLVDWTALRVPLLIEGSVENERFRGSLGIGPEFVVGLAAETDVELHDGPAGVTDADLAPMREMFHAEKQTDTYLCVDLGLAIKVWKLAVTVDVRYSHNLTQPAAYDERLQYEFAGNEVRDIAIIASSSIDLRLLLGIAYELGF